MTTALEQGIDSVADAPAELTALFDDLENPPFPVDYDLIDVGAGALLRCGVAYGIAARQSLFWGYISGPAVKPLAWTAEMREPQAAARRLADTGNWVQAVITPGGMRRNGEGWHSTARVRLRHAHIRFGLRHSDRRDEAAWGAPINQAELSRTIVEFHRLPLRVLTRLGYSFTEREIAGIYALWRLVGHLVGVPLELNPASEAEAEKLCLVHELTAPAADDDSVALSQALLQMYHVDTDSFANRVVSAALEGFDKALAWECLPDGYTDALGIPRSRASHAIPLLALGIRVLEASRRLVPGADRLLQEGNRKLMLRGDEFLRGIAGTPAH